MPLTRYHTPTLIHGTKISTEQREHVRLSNNTAARGHDHIHTEGANGLGEEPKDETRCVSGRGVSKERGGVSKARSSLSYAQKQRGRRDTQLGRC